MGFDWQNSKFILGIYVFKLYCKIEWAQKHLGWHELW